MAKEDFEDIDFVKAMTILIQNVNDVVIKSKVQKDDVAL